jgi:hypothetical protein
MAKAQKPQADQTESKKTSGPSIIKKLSVSTVYGAVKVKDIPEGGELKLCRMAGIATATDSGVSSYGDWRCLVGECAATNYATGEIFIGRSAFVPGAMGDALIDALTAARREDAGASLKFSVDISVKVSPRDENKYEYIVRPVIESDVKNEAMLLLSLEG